MRRGSKKRIRSGKKKRDKTTFKNSIDNNYKFVIGLKRITFFCYGISFLV